jgi:predicted HTH domain antitoxin
MADASVGYSRKVYPTTMQVTVEIPDDLASQLIPAGQDSSRTLLEGAALKAFCEDRVTSYELCQILGFETRYQLDGFLKDRGIHHGAYGPEDLKQDIRTIDRLREMQSVTSRG